MTSKRSCRGVSFGKAAHREGMGGAAALASNRTRFSYTAPGSQRRAARVRPGSSRGLHPGRKRSVGSVGARPRLSGGRDLYRGGGWGLAQRPKGKGYGPELDLQFRALSINFSCFLRRIFVMRVGGWVRRRSPGCRSAPPPPQPPSGNGKPWPVWGGRCRDRATGPPGDFAEGWVHPGRRRRDLSGGESVGAPPGDGKCRGLLSRSSAQSHGASTPSIPSLVRRRSSRAGPLAIGCPSVGRPRRSNTSSGCRK